MQSLRFAQNDTLLREFPWASAPPKGMKIRIAVVPAKAGTHVRWIPAFAGMTGFSREFPWACGPPTGMTL